VAEAGPAGLTLRAEERDADGSEAAAG
jgi:hypothetical protein